MANAVPLSIAGVASLADSVNNESDYSPGSVRSSFRRVAPPDTTVLLTGETGTGKTRLAHIIHDRSRRRPGPFLTVDCGSLSLRFIERASFSQVNGAFYTAIGDLGKLATDAGGTLLLDEVNRLPIPLQDELLDALEDWDNDPADPGAPACLIAATSEPLEFEVRAGRFRGDLYSRLNGDAFHLLPLRQQRSAIAALAHQFLRAAAARSRADVSGFSIGALHLLERYHWPGNIRELRNVVERAVAVCEEREVSELNLPSVVRLPQVPRTEVNEALPAKLHEPGPEEEETLLIEEVLRRRGNKWPRAKWAME